MNKKGFTTVELILTVLLVIIIMGTVSSVTYTYRDRSNYEETLTKVTDYKNTLTKIIYDDILNREDPVIEIVVVTQGDNFVYEYVLKTKSGKDIPLTIIEEEDKVGINYNGIEYLIPGSEDGLVEVYKYIEDKEFYQYNSTNGYSSLEIIFSHRNLEENFKIKLIVA